MHLHHMRFSFHQENNNSGGALVVGLLWKEEEDGNYRKGVSKGRRILGGVGGGVLAATDGLMEQLRLWREMHMGCQYDIRGR